MNENVPRRARIILRKTTCLIVPVKKVKMLLVVFVQLIFALFSSLQFDKIMIFALMHIYLQRELQIYINFLCVSSYLSGILLPIF